MNKKSNTKKYKKNNNSLLAIALSISIFASSFSGVGIIYAKSEAAKAKENTEIIDGTLDAAPTPIITELEPEVDKKDYSDDKDNEKDKDGKENNSRKNIVNSDPSELTKNNNIPYDGTRNLYNIDAKDVNRLMKKGYSIQDITEADILSNQLLIDPETLLDMKYKSNKSFDEIKKDIMDEKAKEVNDYLIKKYKDEYEKLNGQGFTNNEIISFLTYIDINHLPLTDELIENYKNNGEQAFIDGMNQKVSQETIDKYDLSDIDTTGLTENAVRNLVDISEKINTPLKDLIKSYLDYMRGADQNAKQNQ